MGSIATSETATSCPLAIVGIGLRLPGGVTNDSEFWDLLVNKRCARRELPADRYSIDGFYSESGKSGSVRCKYAYCLDEDIGKFDAEFFNISPIELARMDPQQRLLLKVVWECMESGGQVDWQGKDIACFVGVFGEDWLDMTRKDYQNLGQGRVGGTGDFAIANRVSYHYDLTGPRYVLDRAMVSCPVDDAMLLTRIIATAAQFERPAPHLWSDLIWLNVPLQQGNAHPPSWQEPASSSHQLIQLP